MRKFFKISITSALLFITGYIIYLNATLYYEPRFVSRNNTNINIDLLHQLQHLEKEMHNGAANEMQGYYPEGYVFMHSLYGLTWAEMARGLSHEDTLRTHALKEIEYSIYNISSPLGQIIFPSDLPLSYGAFYNGWLNYLRGKYLSVQDGNERDTAIINDFKTGCKRIAAALDSSASPYLESYNRMAWPADMLMCIASLSLHDKIFEPEYVGTIKSWLAKAEQRTDMLGLIPHSCDAVTGEVREPARGSSQSLILNFLYEVDPVYAQEKFLVYKEHFLDSRFGLPGIREYPKGAEGNGDIDSGPVILDIGGAASIVGQRTMGLYGEATTYIALRNSIEAFGMGDDEDSGKNYLLGMLPVADAFIAWSNSVETSALRAEDGEWRTKFQLLSFIVLACVLGALTFIWRKTFLKRRKG